MMGFRRVPSVVCDFVRSFRKPVESDVRYSRARKTGTNYTLCLTLYFSFCFYYFLRNTRVCFIVFRSATLNNSHGKRLRSI